MLRWLTPLLLLALAGCAAPPPKEPIAPVVAVKPRTISIEAAEFDNPRAGVASTSGEWLLVGMTPVQARDRFPAPSQDLLTEPHPALSREQFEAWGWEDSRTGRSFGYILDKTTNRVALAMVQLQNQSEEDVNTLFADYLEHFRENENTIPGATEPIRYHFWQFEGQRVMIAVVTNKRGGFTVTVAAGLDQVMDAIDANEAKAQVAIGRGMKILEKTGKTTPAGS